MKIVFSFLLANWQSILAIIILLTALVIKLKSLWRGNIVQWLVDVCAEVEKVLGSGTGWLKLRSAYSTFVQQFPIISKLIPFETFSVWVDEALALLKEKMATNTKLSDYIANAVDTTETAVTAQ